MMQRTKKSGGYILLFVLIFAAVMTITMGSLATSITTFSTTAKHDIASEQALNLAEAGIDEAIYQLNKSGSYTGETTALGPGTFTSSVTSYGGSSKQITVTAYVPDSVNPIATRIVKVNVTAGNTVVAFHYGIQAGSGGFSLTGGSTVNGSIYSNTSIVASGGSTITGSAIAANPSATSTDQSNNSPTPITSCTSSTCITFANTSATQSLAQKFQISSALPLNSIQLYLKKVGSPGNITVRIVNDNGGAPTSDVVMQGTLSASTVTTSFGWVTVTMPTTPILQPGQPYWIVLDDGSNSSSNYYTIGANAGGYANGVAMIGKYGSAWSNTTPSGLDAYFQIFLGGGTSYIGGATYVGGVQIGSSNADQVWAHQVQGVSLQGLLYCQIGSYNNKSCNSSLGDPPSQSLPLSDNNVAAWKADAQTGTTITGDKNVGWQGATLGPAVITGNLTVNGGGTLTVSGTVYVQGNITVNGGGKIQLASSYGSNDGVIITDGYVSLTGGANFAGSGTAGSYPFLITTSACPADSGCNGNPAIYLSGGAGTVALVAQNGTVRISGGSSLKAVTGAQITMDSGSELHYDSGLISANFSSGPGGSWQIQSGTYTIVQ